ncbi:phosphohydrolase [Clostridium carboxidivorans P7]|uniref:Metal dependent phosphohydrolase n=1 Tax=Clostridium carboxidivorans P7 TaxID=536227 RepID=C6PSD0_9CLOT|nr:HD domain-containing protein [Clostridium carboxidivorans]AKN32608.1 phosphohydrolase [Clostridium carboxidivorans P7]EET87808.1 metal dependent phosphohydrolase [Clostridium carboxidivorans P7]EFG90180.1 HD domain protein [Clostridium carboxidivorans P7]
MLYLEDKKRLDNILLTSKDIKSNKDEILKIIPELIICVNCTQNHPAHIYKVFDHISETVNRVEFDLTLKLAALLHDIGKPYKKVLVDNTERFWGHEDTSAEIAKLVLTRLGYDQDLINKLYILIKYHDHKTFPTSESIKNTINLVGDELVPYLFKLQTADLLSHSEKYYKPLVSKLNASKKFYEEIYCSENRENKIKRKRIITVEDIYRARENILKGSYIGVQRVSKMPPLYKRKDEYSKAVVKMRRFINKFL